MGAVPRYLLRPAGHRPSVVVGTFTTGGAPRHVVRPVADSYFRVESGSGGAWHRVQDTCTALVKVVTISRFLERGTADWFAVGTGALRVTSVTGTSTPCYIVIPIAKASGRVECEPVTARKSFQFTCKTLLVTVAGTFYLCWLAAGTFSILVCTFYVTIVAGSGAFASLHVVGAVASGGVRVEHATCRARALVDPVFAALLEMVAVSLNCNWLVILHGRGTRAGIEVVVACRYVVWPIAH